jgi:peptidoglycan/LPS O-acetylase OafA/YrhL
MNKLQPRIIAGGASLFLDAVRLGAALTVLYGHSRDMWFPGLATASDEPGNTSHAAVAVFFALSGFVITHTTTSNNIGPRHYAQARLSRLYSVLLPALVLTALVELAVVHLAPVLLAEYSRRAAWPRYLMGGSFLNEI